MRLIKCMRLIIDFLYTKLDMMVKTDKNKEPWLFSPVYVYT
jgi:hypothetical protein